MFKKWYSTLNKNNILYIDKQIYFLKHICTKLLKKILKMILELKSTYFKMTNFGISIALKNLLFKPQYFLLKNFISNLIQYG